MNVSSGTSTLGGSAVASFTQIVGNETAMAQKAQGASANETNALAHFTAAAKTLASSKARPASWKASGKPSLPKPQHTVMAGWPVTLNGMVSEGMSRK